jgi:hypothetical protein
MWELGIKGEAVHRRFHDRIRRFPIERYVACLVHSMPAALRAVGM